jgi:hydrogenase maturation protease
VTVLVGGIGQLYQGDLDLGRVAAERLAGEALGADVLVEDLHYGAVAVAQRLQDLRPHALVLVGAVARDRPPGTVERRRIRDLRLPPEQVQRAVADAVTGHVTLDLVVEVAAGFGALPVRTTTVEVEPARVDPAERLSPTARTALEAAIGLVRAEVRRVPLLTLADELRVRSQDARLEPAPALDTMRELLGALTLLEERGRWGTAFALRDRLRRQIADGQTGFGMDHLDWGLWWALIEELDRLQPLESADWPGPARPAARGSAGAPPPEFPSQSG